MKLADTTEADIRNWCSPYGEIKNLQMSNKFCFVQFSSIQEAIEAQRALHDTTVRISPLSSLPPLRLALYTYPNAFYPSSPFAYTLQSASNTNRRFSLFHLNFPSPHALPCPTASSTTSLLFHPSTIPTHVLSSSQARLQTS